MINNEWLTYHIDIDELRIAHAEWRMGQGEGGKEEAEWRTKDDE